MMVGALSGGLHKLYEPKALQLLTQIAIAMAQESNVAYLHLGDSGRDVWRLESTKP